jgi:hypothetical protein
LHLVFTNEQVGLAANLLVEMEGITFQITFRGEAERSNKPTYQFLLDLRRFTTIAEYFGYALSDFPNTEPATSLVCMAGFQDGFYDYSLRINPIVRSRQFLLSVK